MLRVALERGLSSLIARWMLKGRADELLDQVARAGALPPEEIAALRVSTRARLVKLEAEGAAYADLVVEAVSGVRAAMPDLGTLVRNADTELARTVAAAVAEGVSQRAAEAARAAMADLERRRASKAEPQADPPVDAAAASDAAAEAAASPAPLAEPAPRAPEPAATSTASVVADAPPEGA